jgi:two-component system, chemotaxis family, CheB/CheR fusion protein
MANAAVLKTCRTAPVVAIGASTGGLDASKLLLANLPAKTGLAFVFIQELDPAHNGNLPEILARAGAIPVQPASDGMRIQPDHLYVVPPDADAEIANQVLRLAPRGSVASGPHKPIDRFLMSFAQEYGSRAIVVILSGAGTDGAAGLEAVKARGGLTFAQDPGTAECASMPKTAQASGLVDFVLPPEAIAEKLAGLGHHAYLAEDEDSGAMGPTGEEDRFEPILALLRHAAGVDFGLYRETTVRRRIMRRLALRSTSSLDEYRKQIENDPAELSALHRDLLVSVTRFFRDPDSFESLKTRVFPRLVHARRADAAIRIWVPGCASGEDAYSIAIALQEYFEETGQSYPVQIFASDISATSVAAARSGKYAGTIVADAGPQRLSRYFLKVDGGYQVAKGLREMCVFSRHDLLQDPPFSKLDLISCRNVLIYFGGVRKNIIDLFHYALNPGGFLVLGPGEREPGHLFSMVVSAPGIYTRNEAVGKRRPFYAGTIVPSRSADGRNKVTEISIGERGIDLRKELERTLVARYNGAGLVVDESLNVLEILGRTAPYLALPPGRVSFNLLKLIPETRLFLEVEKLVREAESRREPVRKDHIPCQSDGSGGEVSIEVIPLIRARRLLVLFEHTQGSADIIRDPGADSGDRAIAGLKEDLADTRHRLLSIIEEWQSAEEENRRMTQDASSANEELQSLNEELETAKKELQAINEELTRVNEELRAKNAALTEARDFARLIIETVAAPLLVLDADLRIKAANPAFYRAFRISPRDAQDRLLSSVSDGCWDMPRLRDMLQCVLPDHKSVRDFEIEQEFPGIGRRVLLLSACQLEELPQILLGIDDVTEVRERTEATLHESEDRFRNMADAAPVMIWVSGPDGVCTFFNQSWLAFTGRSMEQELGGGWGEGLHPEDRARYLRTHASAVESHRGFQVEYRLRRFDGEYRWLLDNGVPRVDPGGAFAGYVGSCVDITDLKRTQEEDMARRKLESVGTLAGGIAHDFNNLLGGVLAHSELALQDISAGALPEEELRRIRAAAIRGAEIVRQLMIYAGRESESLELVDASQIVEEMLELLRVSVSKHAVVETHLGKDLPAVQANAAQLRQVVMNLIINASEAIGDRDGVIRVTTRIAKVCRNPSRMASEPRAEGDYLQLEISDTGGGMTPETQARVFDPFFTTKATGHGLGLAVVQGIVRSIGGTIRLTSTPGEGTAFQILLPCARQGPQTASANISSVKETAPDIGTATILVVEDENTLRKAVSKMMQKTGFSVIEAGDGHAALNVIRTHDQHVDILLLDITLPGVSSRDVLEEATRLRPDMRVIITSAYSEEMAAATLARRVERFIRKPFHLNELVSLIQKALN